MRCPITSRKIHFSLAVLTLLLALPLLQGCAKSKQSQIVGSWRMPSPMYSIILSLNADGTYTRGVGQDKASVSAGESGAWRIDGSNLVMVPKVGLGAGKECRFTISQLDSDKLVLTQTVMNLPTVQTYQRIGG